MAVSSSPSHSSPSLPLKRKGSGLWHYFLMFSIVVSLISLSQLTMGNQLIRVQSSSGERRHQTPGLVPGLTEWRNDALDRFKKAHPRIEDKLLLVDYAHQHYEAAVEEEANKPAAPTDPAAPASQVIITASKKKDAAKTATTGDADAAKQQPAVTKPIIKFRKPKDTVIYAIAVTDCHLHETLHGAAVLAESIKQNSIRRHEHSNYDYALYAFVHEDAQACNPALYSLGYTILNGKAPHPNVDKEYIKIYALSLTNHRVAVALEVDTIVLQPLDELFDVMLDREAAHLEGNATIPIPARVDFMSTKTADDKLVDHSFFIVRTSQELYQDMADRINKEASTAALGQPAKSFDDFLNDVYGEDHFELDRCVYNTYATTEDCARTPFSQIQLAHYSSCKNSLPWTCPFNTTMTSSPSRDDSNDSTTCKSLYREWNRHRRMLDQDLGNPLPIITADSDSSFGYCNNKNENNHNNDANGAYDPIKINIVNPDAVRRRRRRRRRR